MQRAVERLMATKTSATPQGVNVVETEKAWHNARRSQLSLK
jgi:hypothetical protein